MKKTALLIIFTIVTCSCELIIMDNKRSISKSVSIDQDSPAGTVYLLKVELDSNNIYAASTVFASPSGGKLLAIERYEMYDDISCLRRVLENKQLTSFRIDTLSPTQTKVYAEFDSIRIITFSTEKIQNRWFIVNYNY